MVLRRSNQFFIGFLTFFNWIMIAFTIEFFGGKFKDAAIISNCTAALAKMKIGNSPVLFDVLAGVL
jgi:hypothetical protein